MTGLDRLEERVRKLVSATREAAAGVPGTDPLAGYYISEAEVDHLIATAVDPPEVDGTRLTAMVTAFELTEFDVDVLLTCLAPELDRRFGRLYAYLHDDLNRRSASADLVLTLWCADAAARRAARARLSPGAPLRAHDLVRLDETGPPMSWLECSLRIDDRVTRHLLGDDDPGPGLVRREGATAGGRELVGPLLERLGPDAVVHLAGPRGSGRRTAAARWCAAAGRPLLVVATTDPAELARNVREIAREARLTGAAVLWPDVDALPDESVFMEALARVPGPVFLSGAGPWSGPEPAGRPLVQLTFTRPDAGERLRRWTSATTDRPVDETDPPDLESIATAFRFSADRIRTAATTAWAAAVVRDPARPRLRQADLTAAARRFSGTELARLARPVVTPYVFDDLVLPGAVLGQLRGLLDQIRHRDLVHGTWDFGRTAAPSGGLAALFAGPPGTGKTMAASVLANTLGVELYAVDLATTVSKYIGETEKNLARVFTAAAESNAVLFFDEADALFGKRTQVRDAHDRYANLETSYLLQQIEIYPGVVVLATNLRRNLDEAFVRRFRVALDFPSPDEAERRLIWERIWPAAAPLAADVDLGLLARHVELPGGHIRNIALEGAFRAAADGGKITMAHLLRATRSEYEKLGKILATEAFGGAPDEAGWP